MGVQHLSAPAIYDRTTAPRFLGPPAPRPCNGPLACSLVRACHDGRSAMMVLTMAGDDDGAAGTDRARLTEDGFPRRRVGRTRGGGLRLRMGQTSRAGVRLRLGRRWSVGSMPGWRMCWVLRRWTGDVAESVYLLVCTCWTWCDEDANVGLEVGGTVGIRLWARQERGDYRI